MSRFLIVILLLCGINETVNAQSKAAAHLRPPHREVVKRWLAGRPNLRLATVADFSDKVGLAAYRKHGGGDDHPYYTVGDFNGDKAHDFAVALVNVRKRKDRFALAIFNGPLGKQSVPAYFSQDWDLRRFTIGQLKGESGQTEGLLACELESDNCATLVPRGSGYVINDPVKEFVMTLDSAVSPTAGSSAAQQPRGFTVVSVSDVEPTGADFSMTGYTFRIQSNGRGIRTSLTSNGPNQAFSLGFPKGQFLGSSLFYAEYNGDILLAGDIGDDINGFGFIVRLDGQSLRIQWKQVIDGFNVGQGLIEGDHAYVTSLDMVGKLDLRTGRYLWKHRGLYGEDGAFNSFELPELDGQTVIFRETEDLKDLGKLPERIRRTRASVTVDKHTGKIIKLVR